MQQIPIESMFIHQDKNMRTIIHVRHTDMQQLKAVEQAKIVRKMINLTIMHLKLIFNKLNISVYLTNDKEMQNLNWTHRKLNKTTNILSFPYVDIAQEQKNIEDIYCIGELIISHETILTEAQNMAIPEEHHLAHLVVHGTLHLLGYDHERGLKDAVIMEALETEILTLCNIPNPYQTI